MILTCILIIEMNKCAVIVDTRPIDQSIIDNHMKFLPGWDLRIVNILPENSIAGYNKLLTSKEFWKSLPETVLIFQQDSGLLREGIQEFIGWDYVGAPWPFQQHGGNGGLSLRHRDAMIEVINKVPYNGDNEDIYFCNNMNRLGMNLALRSVCDKFSAESIFKLGTLGYHGISNWLTKEQCELIRNQYGKY